MLGIVKAKKVKRRITLLITLAPRQRADPDCYWKSLLDGMKLAGLIVNDSAKWVELPPVQFARGKQIATRITLEDMS